MRFRWKSYIFIPFLTVFYLCGCYAPPAFKPITAVKPPRKVEPYIISQLDRYFVRDWKYVVIHHSASPTGCATEFDKYHREKKVGKMDWDIIL